MPKHAYLSASASHRWLACPPSAKLCAAHPESGSRVTFDFVDAEAHGFAPPFRMKLDCSKLRALGWTPKVGLMEMFDRMMADMKGEKGR